MKSAFQLIGAVLLLAVGGCAGVVPGHPEGEDARLHLDRGLAAVAAERYRDAFDELTWVYTRCAGHEAGTRALAALAALELDPRNPAARPDVGSELLGRLIQDPGLPQWTRPLAETGFLTALALGAPHPEGPVRSPETDSAAVDSAAVGSAVLGSAAVADAPTRAPIRPTRVPAPAGETDSSVYGCGATVAEEDWQAPRLPRLPGPSLAAMLTDTQLERDSLAVRADTLQQELITAREELAATQEELERIRRTLKP